ncbi:MAG: GntR family transcriptional regulator [Chloroflexi bacterium]|nr:GntR family transcriptional regulator [Chloroflexota bacterium]
MPRSLKPLAAPRTLGYREAAYLAIKEAILSGDLQDGQPLIEEEIAAKLQVSRTPVREALSILQHEGLIAPRSGRGFYVRSLTREDFVEMFVANEVVEPYLARHAALLATEAQLRDMEAAIQCGIQAAADDDLPGILRSGRDFHRAVGEAAGNASLTRYVVTNEERTDLYLLSYGKDINISRMSPSNQEHSMIFAAIRRRDPEAAARLVIYHSQSVRERFAPLFHQEMQQEEETKASSAD